MEKKVKSESAHQIIKTEVIESKLALIRNQQVIADADVAALYGVDTRRINEAVNNNPDKFPPEYLFELTDRELRDLRSKISTTKVSVKSRNTTKVFSERGLYMLATILKSEQAKAVTFAIIETFYKVRSLKRELISIHKETDKEKQISLMNHFGGILTDVVMPELETHETESTLEINFVIGKLKHTVKRIHKEKE